MASNNPAAKVSLNFLTAEHYYKRSLVEGKTPEGRKTCREIACSCYLEGLKILNASIDLIEPLRYLELCFQERDILTTYILPKGAP